MTEPDALRTLNLDAGCSRDQIRHAYVDLVKVWHPDRFQGDAHLRVKAERTLQRINEAYAVLQRRADPSPAPEQPVPNDSVDHDRPEPVVVNRPAAGRPTSFPRRVALAVVIGAAVGVTLTLSVALRSSAGSPSERIEATPSTLDSDIQLPANVVVRNASAGAARPESGSQLRSPARTGVGALSIRNDMPQDALVILARDTTRDRVLFIRRGEKVALFDVLPGTYGMRVIVGTEWNGSRFGRASAYYESAAPMTVAGRDGARMTNPPAIALKPGSDLRPVPAFGLE